MNKSNLFLIVAIIAVGLTLANLIVVVNKINYTKKLTGYVTNVGYANLTIESAVNINFTTNSINWQSGRVNTGQINATLDTAAGTVTNGNWTAVSNGLVLENIGNVNASIEIKSGQTAAQFLGGTNPKYQWNFTNVESDSCTVAAGVSLSSWYDTNTTDPGTDVCDVLGFDDAADTMRIDIKLVVPYNSNTGALGDIITATATTV